jgi:glycosyltransferase involved in cell wall biosynthesis
VTEDTGWTFKAEDTEELADRMREVCGLSLERLHEMGEATIAIAADYAPEACAKRILANLQELVDRRRSLKGLVNGHA